MRGPGECAQPASVPSLPPQISVSSPASPCLLSPALVPVCIFLSSFQRSQSKDLMASQMGTQNPV